jgi:N-acetylglucosaminyl-diphospho-decaprenol L-rhamnosyltransferase
VPTDEVPMNVERDSRWAQPTRRTTWGGKPTVPSPPLDLDVGVIYTHEDHFMRPLLTSLAASGDGITSRLLLVDNVSANGPGEWTGIVPETRTIVNDVRLGYGPNLNRILEVSTARYVLLLNTDMYFDPAEQMPAKMVAFMDANPDCGVSGCRLYREDGSYGYPARRFLTMRMIAARRMGVVGRWFAGHEAQLLYEDRDPHEVFDCDWLSGCLLMVRREAYAEVGGFDECFAKYFEDVDFCARTAAAGWRVTFNGGTFGYHLEQRASLNPFSRDGWAHLRSYARWLRKWGIDPAATIRARRTAVRRAA